MSKTLPISNVINISLTGVPAGISTKNANAVGLFTTEQPSNIDAYRIYLSPSDVASDYGSDSETYKMASRVFSQAPNLLSGNGYLAIIPLIGSVSATSAKFLTPDISTHLTALKAVTSGDLKVTIDGVANNLTGLNFSNCLTLADVASIIKAKLDNALVYVDTNKIVFESKKVGLSDSTIVLASVSGGTGTDLTGATLLNVAGGSNTAGTNASGETLVTAIDRMKDVVFFCGVMTNLEMQDSVIQTTAEAVQAMDRIFVHHFVSKEDLNGIIYDIQQATLTKTRCLLYTVSKSEANLHKAGVVGRLFSMNFTANNTSFTMNLRTIAGSTPDSNINQTNYNLAKTNGADLYVNYEGDPAYVSNGANLFVDDVYQRLALKFYLEAQGYNYLKQTNYKIAQTEKGMDGLKDAYAKICETFLTNGFIGQGLEWNSADTFGDPVTFKRNITEKGYYIFSQPIAKQLQSERAQRKAPVIQIAVKQSGAIHHSDVIVSVEA